MSGITEPNPSSLYPKWTITVAQTEYEDVVRPLARILCAEIRVDAHVPVQSCYVDCEVGSGWATWSARHLHSLGEIQHTAAADLQEILCLTIAQSIGVRMEKAVREALEYHCIEERK